ncbi:MAG: prenyltransferase/squalene oxidase repeat-containing protein [Phycisphaerales bacterium]
MIQTAGSCTPRPGHLTLMMCVMLFVGAARGQTLPVRPDMVTAQTEQAIEKGLAYLVRTQSRDGSWRTGTNYGSYPTTMTSLAGIALMAGGNTPVEGRYALNVRRAVDFILASANDSGLISRMGEESRSMYGHGFSMLFLAEAYGMEQDVARQQRIRRVLENAVALTGKAQSRDGGWIYTPDAQSDEGSVTVTQIQGLRAVRNAGIKVPKEVVEKAVQYIEKSANADGGIRYTVRGGGGSLVPITAAAVAVLYNAGQYENPVAGRCLEFLKKHLAGAGGGNPNRISGGHKFYTMLYLAQGMYLSSEENWKSYFPAVRDDLIATQSAEGSWEGDGVGPTYGTAIALITLQLPYQYLPILQR